MDGPGVGVGGDGADVAAGAERLLAGALDHDQAQLLVLPLLQN
jgi:hypothetical protein